jgi:branched-chain amino acid transport system substrate-binding protein
LIDRKIAWLPAIAALALLAGTAAPSRAADAPYEINVIMPLTGGGAFLAGAQQASLKALETNVNKHGGIKGRPLQFVFFDDQTNPQVSVQLTNQILAKKVPIIMGSSLSGMCRAMIPLFAQSGPVQYCLSPAVYPPKGAYTFSSSVSTKDLIVATVRYFRERGWTKIGRITTTDASGQDADRDFDETLALPENKGVTIVASEHFNPPDTSVSAQAAKVKAAGPQAIVVWAPGTPFGTALRALSDVGLDVPVATSNANMVAAQLKQYTGFLPKELYMQGVGFIAGVAANPQMKAAETDFETSIHGAGIANIDFQTGMAWDPAMILVSALNKLGPAATADQIRDYILNLKGFAGISGVYDFTSGNQHGLDVKDVVIMKYDAAKNGFTSVSKLGGLPLK